MMEQRNPFTPPKANLELATPGEVHGELSYAGFWRRFAAHWIDAGLLLPLAGVTYLVGEASRMGYIYWGVVGLIIAFWFNVYLVGRFGGTPGKLLLKTRVALSSGAPPNMWAATLRYGVTFALAAISSVGIWFAVAGMSDQTYHSLGYVERMERLLELAPRWASATSMLLQVWVLSEFVTMFFNRRRRSLHDLIAGTVVVRMQGRT